MTDVCPCCEPTPVPPHWWIVTCRMAFDDEDSFFIFDAPTQADAVRRAKEELADENSYEPATEDDQLDFILNYVFDCGEHKPALALCNF